MSMEVREPSAKYLARPGYKQTEVGIIPEDWNTSYLARIADVRGGIAKNSNATISDPISVHYLRVANVQDGFLDLADVSKIEIDRQDLKRYSVLPGDVLMNEGGDLDKLGRGAIWKGEFSPCVHQNHVFVVRCKSQLLPEYLDVWTGTRPARRFFLLAGKQTTNLASISKSSLGELPVALPPLPEQHAIAAALSDVDALLGGLERLIAKKRDLKQAAMQQLLTGQTRLPGFSGEWEVKRLGDVSDPTQRWGFTGGPFGSNLKSSDYTDDGVRIIQLQNIGDGVFLDDYKIFTSHTKADELISCNIYPGEIILSKMGDPVARACIIPPMHDRFLMCSDGIRLSVDQRRFCTHFIYTMINAPEFREKAANAGTGSTRKRIGLTELRNLELNCPALPEQTAIATVLSDMDAELATLEARRDKTRALKQAMMQELLTGRIRLL